MPSSANIRIARNTAVIYVRMVVTILVGIITSRLVLQALGASDVVLEKFAEIILIVISHF